MRKIMAAGFIVICLQASIFAQVLNTASTLRPGSFSLSIAPVIYVDRGNDLGLFLSGGFGIARDIDLALKLNLENGGRNYFGGDVEFSILRGMPSISLALGAHAYRQVGLDGTLNITFPIHRTVALFSGLDFDAEFHDHGQDFPLWVPVGLEVMLRSSLSLIMEIDIAATEPATNIFALGMSIFF
jgi:hypothetical protein